MTRDNQATLGNGCVCASGCDSCDQLAEAFEAMREALRYALDAGQGAGIVKRHIDRMNAALARADKVAG
jgi:hypothetical protein